MRWRRSGPDACPTWIQCVEPPTRRIKIARWWVSRHCAGARPAAALTRSAPCRDWCPGADRRSLVASGGARSWPASLERCAASQHRPEPLEVALEPFGLFAEIHQHAWARLAAPYTGTPEPDPLPREA